MKNIERCNVLGVGVHAVNLPQATAFLAAAVRQRRRGYVCVTGVHGVMEARKSPEFRRTLNRSLLTVPDGMPLVWLGRRRGFTQMGRVYGPDLMLALCEQSVREHWTHFLYGGQPGVADELKAVLTRRFGGIRIVGTYCPPFRPLNEHERQHFVGQIAETRPDLFWVGLSTPKQERFMAAHLADLDTTLMLGVGAAFDVHTGRLKDAPAWMKHAGLQWLHRLLQEPRRLAPRYASIVPAFLFLLMLEKLGIVRYSLDEGDRSP
jgi:N-acetylglucosaminyldiphosphoundecaprenol N-acetyl-beta-D-mannosaminyltransferase